MNKRPASLTSDLLARKGEATPSSVDPAARTTPGTGADVGMTGPGFSDSTPGLFIDEDEEDVLELRPRPPEPEVIYTAEDEEEGTKPLRIVAGLVVAAIAVGGIVLAVTSKTERGAAPVTQQVTQQGAQGAPQDATPETAPTIPSSPTPAALPDTNSASAVSPAEEDPVNSPYTAYAQKPEAQQAPAAVPVETSPADATPVPSAPAATKPTSAPVAAPASGGDYVVQLFALKDEGSARKAYQDLAQKHALLKAHEADIERADLGSKGIYYRVRATGFSSRADAASACAKLKTAGQQCMVTKR